MAGSGRITKVIVKSNSDMRKDDDKWEKFSSVCPIYWLDVLTLDENGCVEMDVPTPVLRRDQ